MNIYIMQKQLSSYDNKLVDLYIRYVTKLKTEKKRDWTLINPRAKNVLDDQYINYFMQVKQTGLHLDWKHISIQSTWISYDYVALKNMMLLAYPESMVDIELVHEWDDIKFDKSSWSINYTHNIADPFAKKDDNIVWAYVVIKNKRWEFLTTLWKLDLEKHRKTAKQDYIWSAWFAEMCMKTVMKKACKTHFNDIFETIEDQDNQNHSLDNWDIDIDHKSVIDLIDDIDALRKYATDNTWKWKDLDNYLLERSKIIKWKSTT